MASNLSNIVFPGQFNPKTDKWCEYKERLLCALDAAGVSAEPADEQRARSLFLSQCGKDTYSLIVSLLVPKRPTSVGFYDILLVLDKFYEPEVNEILEAGKFHKRLQIQGESVQDFVSAISLMAAKCNFVDLKRQLRDRLVLGVRDDRLRRDLLKTTDLTYERAVQLCLNYQAAFHDLYPDTSEMKQTPSSKFGHIASACMKKSGKVHQVGGDDQPSTPSEDMMGVYVCSDNTYRAPITAELSIDGAKLSMEVDTGASRSIISEETYRKLWQVAPPLQSTNVKLVTWTREPLKVLGVTHVRVVLGNKEAQCELLVVSGKGPSLLGRNWFQALCLDVAGLCWTDDKISRLMSEFPDLFNETLGEYKGPEISLHVRPDAKPRFLKARPVPFPLKKQVEEELNRMVESGVLTPVRYSKWATPLRLVKKDDGALRICGDYRSTVNSAIDVDTYPLTAAVEAFVNLSGGRVFSKLDLKHAYLQMKVDEDTAMLLTLNTPLGLMRMNRLAFGVNAAPGIFQRVMSSALAGMAGVACLLDDVALTGRTAQEHDQRLRAVLQKLTDMGFRLNLKKCVFASNSINFLGHTIDAEGLHPSPEKVREIKDKPAPTNKGTLRAFLGLYNFYEKFLPDKATLLEPLYRLLESKRPWVWGDVEQKAFEDAKSLLSSDMTLVGYDLNKELLLICDSSEYGLGAVIAHIMEDGSERPVMMASRTLQPHERRYGQIDKEALAIMYGVIIPQSLQKEVLKLLHEPHAGIVQTKACARGYVWWAGMDQQIERVVAECEACQAVRNNPPRDPQTWIVPEKPWSRVHVDFAGPFQGKTFIVLIDSYSKWFEAEIIQSMSSGTVINVMRKIFASQGLPDVLVSDNGRAFSSVEFNMFLKKNGIRHLYSPPYHLATNGQIERAIQTFKNKLKKMSESDIPWSEKMPKALYALRTVPNSCTNKSPAEMLNGRKYRTAVSALHPAAAPSAAARQAEAAAHSAPAQPVLVRMYQAPDKWQRATVEQVEGPSSYMVRTEDGELHRRHADQMLARAVPTPRVETPLAQMHRPAVSMPSSPSTSDEPIVIPPPDMWPDIIGIPNSC
ncbi:uncharacterized protein K02A2.6-like [Plutella xylostella]|uniref:uncharacterized protein K02A2.6-like n=1 Tax=Plutella xylostella TaxID=51655 RepID=UPI0020322629|nr:uncharacterized protein K02A2.6-like [Plutella xylostella]